MSAITTTIKRFFIRYLAIFFVMTGFWLWIIEFFSPNDFLETPGLYFRLLFILALLMLLIYKSLGYLKSDPEKSFLDLQISALALLTINIALQFSGSFVHYLFPLNYLLLALIAAYASFVISFSLVFFLSGTELIHSYLRQTFVADLETNLFHLLFSLVFVAFIGQVLRLERSQQKRAKMALDRLRRDQQELDPTTGPSGLDRIGPDARERQNVDHLFLQDRMQGRLAEIARRALVAHSVVFLSLDFNGLQLSMDALASEGDDIDILKEFPLENSAFAAAASTGSTANYRKLPTNLIPEYYSKRIRLKSMIIAPAFRNNHLVGMVAADSLNREHFGEEEELFLESIAQQAVEIQDKIKLIRNIQNEREQFAAFYEVASKLSASLKIQDVLHKILTASSSIVGYDFASLTLVDEYAQNRSVIHEVFGMDEELKGQSFAHKDGLVGWVTQLNTYLAHPDFTKVQRPVFSPGLKVKGIKSLLCLPLPIGDWTIGTLTFMWRSKNSFNDYDRKILEVLAIQASVSIENARIYEKMEKMAITDGLTGLYNHRYFQEWFEKELLRAKRMPIKMSMILTDIDHFKKVNDTYGHPVGDIVLKEMAAILRESVRNVDIAARYGGEEFAIVLLDTDQKGAIKFAERIRKRIEKTKIHYPDGVLSITISIGISTYQGPEDSKESLIERSDIALYHSKDTGRNRATHANDLPPETFQKSEE